MENAKLQSKLKEFDLTIKNLMQEQTSKTEIIQKYAYDNENGRKKMMILEKEMEKLRESLNEKYTENDFHIRNTQDLENLQINYQDKIEKLIDENKIFFNQIDELKRKNFELEKEKRLTTEEITNVIIRIFFFLKKNQNKNFIFFKEISRRND